MFQIKRNQFQTACWGKSFIRKSKKIVTTLGGGVNYLLEYIFFRDVKPIEFKGDIIELISFIFLVLKNIFQLQIAKVKLAFEKMHRENKICFDADYLSLQTGFSIEVLFLKKTTHITSNRMHLAMRKTTYTENVHLVHYKGH